MMTYDELAAMRDEIHDDLIRELESEIARLEEAIVLTGDGAVVEESVAVIKATIDAMGCTPRDLLKYSDRRQELIEMFA